VEIPLGTDAKQAQSKLEHQGFTCTWQRNSQFVGIVGLNDYLYCDITKSFRVLMERRWQVAVVHKDFTVTDIQVGIGLTGP
jgi:hypothetical protein